MDEHPIEHPVVVGIRFRAAGQIYDFDPGGLLLQRDDRVLVETERGPTLATVAVPPARRPVSRPLNRVVKKADARDLSREDRNLQRERELHRTVLGVLGQRRAAYKLVKVESAFDGSRVTAYIAAEERLDLRDVARELADSLHTRIDARRGSASSSRSR
jgi:cell fate regulator YaaT (PSP1 superfamily)